MARFPEYAINLILEFFLCVPSAWVYKKCPYKNAINFLIKEEVLNLYILFSSYVKEVIFVSPTLLLRLITPFCAV
jgi:hypothetical protein